MSGGNDMRAETESRMGNGSPLDWIEGAADARRGEEDDDITRPPSASSSGHVPPPNRASSTRRHCSRLLVSPVDNSPTTTAPVHDVGQHCRSTY